MKQMHILYIMAIIFGLISFFQVSYLNSAISSLFILLFSYFGIWLYNKNKLISTIQFVLCGVLFYILVCGNLNSVIVFNYQIFSIISSILFIIVGIIIYSDYHENKNLNEENSDVENNNGKYWLIPIITFMFILTIFISVPYVVNGLTYPHVYSYSDDHDTSSKINIRITDHNYANYSYYYDGTVYGYISSDNNPNGLYLKTYFYYGDKLLDEYDYSTESLYPNEENRFLLQYNSSNGLKANQVQIDVYDGTTKVYLDTQIFNI